MELVYKYQVQKVYIDATNPSFIRSLKLEIGDREDYEKQIAYYKKMKWNWHNHMIVIPVSFNVEHKVKVISVLQDEFTKFIMNNILAQPMNYKKIIDINKNLLACDTIKVSDLEAGHNSCGIAG